MNFVTAASAAACGAQGVRWMSQRAAVHFLTSKRLMVYSIKHIGGGVLLNSTDRTKSREYLRAVVAYVIAMFNGDASRVVLAGFSRDAIGENYIGLGDDETAAIWRGEHCICPTTMDMQRICGGHTQLITPTRRITTCLHSYSINNGRL